MTEAKQAIPEIELFSEVGGSPRIFKLEGHDAIGIEIGGKVCIKPLAEWHRLGWESSIRTEELRTPPAGKHGEVIHLPDGLHRDTQNLVMLFAEAMAYKLNKAQEKYGYDNGWKGSAWEKDCRDRLHEHLAKGDPRDVANYCAFMWHHGWSTEETGPDYWCMGCGSHNKYRSVTLGAPGEPVDHDMECTVCGSNTFAESLREAFASAMTQLDTLRAETIRSPQATQSEQERCEHGVWKADHCWSCSP